VEATECVKILREVVWLKRYIKRYDPEAKGNNELRKSIDMTREFIQVMEDTEIIDDSIEQARLEAEVNKSLSWINQIRDQATQMHKEKESERDRICKMVEDRINRERADQQYERERREANKHKRRKKKRKKK